MCDIRSVQLNESGKPVGCKCWRAVMQTYAALTAYNNPEKTALEAAVRVYRFHHPEDGKEGARLIVERWVNHSQLH